jgi:hypothetical protein
MEIIILVLVIVILAMVGAVLGLTAYAATSRQD